MIKKIVLLIIIFLILIFGISAIIYSPEYMYRILVYRESDINDFKIFPERYIEKSQNAFIYDYDLKEDIKKLNIKYSFKNIEHENFLENFLINTKTTSFIIIKNNKIIFEEYYNGFSRDSITTSFSSVKSVVSLLIGIAIDKGYINSEKDSISKYIEEFKDSQFEKITIEDLLLMRSNIKYKEGFLWFGDDAKTYYMPDLRNLALKKLKIDKTYNGFFHYNNYHPLLLGLIIERSTGKKVSQFLEEHLWTKIGTEFEASWSLDSEKSGFEKMESGLNFRPIDFIKIGSMLLNSGTWNGEKIICEDWIKKSTFSDFPINNFEYSNSFLENKNNSYKYMWYVLKNNIKGYDYFAAGKYGQFLYISPENDIVILRTGKENGNIDWWPDFFNDLISVLSKKYL